MPAPKKVHLKSASPSIRMGAVSLITVGKKGAVKDPPEKFIAGQGEIVVWGVANASGGAISVTLKEFLRKKHVFDDEGDPNQPVTPFKWVGSDSIKLAVGAAGFIGGRVDYKPKDGIDGIKYTIEVIGSDFAFAYDPDGDIKP
ncbi:MAG TPA: hypothetical protein VJN96_16250 [Vicinamibacterales bacterium]|nr:hypothetical protein [Vicinamibacterales bacterium]